MNTWDCWGPAPEGPDPDEEAEWLAAYRERAKLVGHIDLAPLIKVTVERRSPSPWRNLPRVLGFFAVIGLVLLGLMALTGAR